MDAQTLQQVMPGLDSGRAELLAPLADQAMNLGGINTVNRAAMFLAQIGEESLSLRFQSEIGGGVGKPYFPYCGRTFIQITWDFNYRAFGSWCVSRGLLDDPDAFVKVPASLAQDQWAWLGPVWYWTVARPTLNHFADLGDIETCTRLINGGLNGLDDRTTRFHNAHALGDAILPTPSTGDELMPAEVDQIIGALTEVINHDMGVLLFGDSPEAAAGLEPRTHPNNLTTIKREIDSLHQDLARIKAHLGLL
jgi:predicted chitinase